MAETELTDLEEITITRDEALDIREALDTLYHYCLAQDLSNQYKNLGARVQKSPLTKQAQWAHETITKAIKGEGLAD